jgi:predicted MFS family arabinose efflux permease
MLPVFARHVLGVGPEWLGGLVAADGLGALLGALAIAGRRGFLPHGRIFGMAVLTAPFLLLGFTGLRWPWACLPVLVLIGACESAFAAMQSTLVLLQAPEASRGRAMGILSACIGTQPAGNPLDRVPRRRDRGAGSHGDQRHGGARRDAARRLAAGPPGPDLTRY